MQDIIHFFNENVLLCAAWIVVLLLLIAVIIRERLAGPRLFSVSELTQLINNGEAVLYDIRSDRDYNVGHIGQAMNFPLSSVNDNTVLYRKVEPYKDKYIILVCKDGFDSKQQGFKLKTNGLEKVGCLNGGMQTWISEGLPTVT